MQIEAEQLAAYGKDDPVLAGAAARWALLAEAAKTLSSRQTHDTLDDDMLVSPRNDAAASRLKNSSAEMDALINAGWSMRKLSKALKLNKYEISYTSLGTALRSGKISPELKRAIFSATKIKI